ncbi:exopolyphosphatase [Mariprofundus ferrinatatus]|uniref:Exopolyphosphatase n=1 Tax=Mariprofundus ferrinatatus TaxID=1921087 RepID=A0A2K8L957_9PROT|nr:Ppx/GppA phosphatase family protein [Mariprofundus ferrinatatus]ATX81464.1 exopolyphosphatase [Mariprofundus ferrinatatus]
MSESAYAAIDSGSNTFRLLIAEPSKGRLPWREIDYAHRITRLGEGLHHTGRLSEAGMQRAIAAYREFALLLQKHGVPAERTFAAATAAVREAENGQAFCEQVKSETGLEIRVISGEDEARMSLNGACSALNTNMLDDMLLFDIGGGSTEFIRARNMVRIDDISCKLGVVRLVEAHLHSDPPSPEDYSALKQAADAHLTEVEAFWPDRLAPTHLVGTAGTVTTLAATALDLFPYDAEKINNYRMSRHAFLSLRDRLLALTHEERLNVRTIEAGRADLIIAGLAIIESVMDRWNYDALVSVDAGLLEGLWLEVADQQRT